MQINIDEVAGLARIKLKPEEKAKLTKDLGSILSYVEQLSKLKTDDVLPTSHVLEIENVFREDVKDATDVREEVLSKAPEREENFFKVPKIVEGN